MDYAVDPHMFFFFTDTFHKYSFQLRITKYTVLLLQLTRFVHACAEQHE